MCIIGQTDLSQNKDIKRMDSWKNDVAYILKNKTFMLCCTAGTLQSFGISCIAWWAPHYFGDALRYRNETLPIGETSADLKIEK